MTLLQTPACLTGRSVVLVATPSPHHSLLSPCQRHSLSLQTLGCLHPWTGTNLPSCYCQCSVPRSGSSVHCPGWMPGNTNHSGWYLCCHYPHQSFYLSPSHSLAPLVYLQSPPCEEFPWYLPQHHHYH